MFVKAMHMHNILQVFWTRTEMTDFETSDLNKTDSIKKETGKLNTIQRFQTLICAEMTSSRETFKKGVSTSTVTSVLRDRCNHGFLGSNEMQAEV